jgi:hypothetical protein
MRTTVFELRSGGVVPDVRVEPSWEPFEEFDGNPLVSRPEPAAAPGRALPPRG